MSTNYVNFGGNIFAIGPDGIPIKVPGVPKPDEDPEGSQFSLGRGRYEIPDTHILVHIMDQKQMIMLVVGKKFSEVQRDCLLSLIMTYGKDFPMELKHCTDRTIMYDVDKFVSSYNLIAKA